jgi:hippurate hydrolase
MAVVLGTTMVLKDIGFEKCVKFIFQPAEEGVGGALPMIDEGVLENPRVKYMLGFHVWPMVDVGRIEVKGGASMASADDFYIKFRGSGGHAAMPYLCKNPLYPAIDFVQTITAKSKMENDPLNPHVVTISSINGGSAPNVIPDEVEVMGTVRTFDERLRHKLYDDIKSMSGLCAQKYGCDAKLNYIFQYPPLINDEKLAESFAACSKKALGKGNVLPLKETFAAEDFSYFAERVPSVHFRLGISDGIKGVHPLHSSEFDASDDAIYHGINVLTNFILSI